VTQRPRLVVGMSGSSAPHYGIALLETLHALGSVETHLVLSDGARRTIQLEADLDPEVVCRLADVVHHPNNLAASISSGSFLSDGPLAGAHLPLHVRSELCGRLPCELLHRRRVRQSDPAPEGSGRVVAAANLRLYDPAIQHALGNHGPELPVTIAPRQWLM
jgi:hypothetical protein